MSFLKVYLKTYKSNLIQKVKADLKGKTPSPFELHQVPGAAAPVVVFSGYFNKRGKFFTNWKKRFFVIRSDGSCQYYGREGEAQAKGVIALEGYTVNAEPKTDIFAGKDHFFTCEHYDDGKRMWFLHADSAEDKVKAVNAFVQAARIASGYVNPDKVAGASFQKAYASLRHSYDMVSKTPRGTEEEALADLLYERLYAVVVSEVVRSLADPAKTLAVKAAKTLSTTLVSASWKALNQSVEKMRPTIEDTLRTSLQPFVDAEEELKHRIREEIGEELINPAVSKVLAPFFAQLVPLLYPMLLHALQTQLEISMERLDRSVPDVTTGNEAQLFASLRRLFDITPALNQLPSKKIEIWLSKVDEILQMVAGVDDFGGMASKIKSFITETVKPGVHLIFPPSVDNQMIKIVNNTIYTFEDLFKQEGDSKAAAQKTVSMLEHDLRYAFTAIVLDSLKEFVRKPYEDFVIAPATKSIEPLGRAIPAEFLDIIDPEATLKDLLEETLTDAVNESARPKVDELSGRLSTILEKKGIPVLQALAL